MLVDETEAEEHMKLLDSNTKTCIDSEASLANMDHYRIDLVIPWIDEDGFIRVYFNQTVQSEGRQVRVVLNNTIQAHDISGNEIVRQIEQKRYQKVTEARIKACLHVPTPCPSPPKVNHCAFDDGSFDGQNGCATHFAHQTARHHRNNDKPLMVMWMGSETGSECVDRPLESFLRFSLCIARNDRTSAVLSFVLIHNPILFFNA